MNNLVAGDSMIARIKELETELAELKASTPRIKHDAIMEAANSTKYKFFGDDYCFVSGLKNYAKGILTQAKEAAE